MDGSSGCHPQGSLANIIGKRLSDVSPSGGVTRAELAKFVKKVKPTASQNSEDYMVRSRCYYIVPKIR
jgi:hypothetical protein